jgi:hypothetical protein
MRRLVVLGLGVLLAAACTRPTVTAIRSAEPGLPQPDRVIVHEFGVMAAEGQRREDPAWPGR